MLWRHDYPSTLAVLRLRSTFRSGLARDLSEYSADGAMFDYMAGVRHIPISLAVELWGSGDGHDKGCFDLFNPPSDRLGREIAAVRPLYDILFRKLPWHVAPPAEESATWQPIPGLRVDSLLSDGRVRLWPLLAVAIACISGVSDNVSVRFAFCDTLAPAPPPQLIFGRG